MKITLDKARELLEAMGYEVAEQAEQEPFDMDDHPPHRLCECRKCMEYFTDKAHKEALAISCHGCDYCNNHLFAGTKCNNCGRKALAEQAEQSQHADATLEPFLEVFCDPSYFDMWCVRDVHDKDFNHTIHVNSKETANHAKLLIENWVKKYSAPVSIAKQSETDSSSSLMRTTVRTKDNCNHLQDLTDEEIVSVLEYYDHEWDETTFSIAHAAIKKFKEKNK